MAYELQVAHCDEPRRNLSLICPVHQFEDGWYFWDETQADRVGPFSCASVARAELHRYCKEVLKEKAGLK